MINLTITAFSVIALLRKFSRDSEVGWAWFAALMLILPSEVRFHLPGSLPELTIHRILLGLGLIMLFRQRNVEEEPARLPLKAAFWFMGATQFVSVLFATEKVASLKDWLGFMIEQFMFAWILWRCIETRRGVRLLLGGVAAAMLVVGLIAAVERYGGTNLAAHYIAGMKDDARSVTATFRHRILFGYFMAFGLPMMLAFVSLNQTKWKRYGAWVGLLLSAAGSYLSISRGPWLGAALGCGFMGLVGGKQMRRLLIILGTFAVLVMLTRPGVYDTLERFYQHTKTTDTHKGRSFYYRLELWGVAWRSLSTSVERTAFGFGGGSLETMDLSNAFNYGGGAGNLGYTSWDSEIAAMFMKFGVVGMVAAIWLFGGTGFKLLLAVRTHSGEDRLIIAGCAGAFGVFLFCMTNVAIFNPQVRFLAWLAVVIGLKNAWIAEQSEAPKEIEVEDQNSSWESEEVVVPAPPERA